MFSIVTHNANGTVYNVIPGFDTLDAAGQYRIDHAHLGIGDSPIVDEKDVPEILRINDRWSSASQRLYKAGSTKAQKDYEATVQTTGADALSVSVMTTTVTLKLTTAPGTNASLIGAALMSTSHYTKPNS